MSGLIWFSSARQSGPAPLPADRAAPPQRAALLARPFSARVVLSLVRLADLLLLIGAGFLATAVVALFYGVYPGGHLAVAAVIGSVVTVASLNRNGVYALSRLRDAADALLALGAPLLAGGVAVAACFFLLDDRTTAFRAWPLAWIAAGGVLTGSARLLLSRLLRRWTRSGRLVRTVALVGVNEFSFEFVRRLRDDTDSYRIVGIYDDRLARVAGVHADTPVRGTVDDLVLHSRQERIDSIIVALPLAAADRIAAILERLQSSVADICLTTDVAGLRYSGAQLGAIGANPVVSVAEHPMKDWKAVKKACFDHGLCCVLLLAASPLLLAIAIAIKLTSKGPVLFRQPRIGFNNLPFTIYKFRTMHMHMSDLLADRQTVRDDPRLTSFGKWLRKSSLDELPQLLNVLRGDMSLVGPRPHAPNTKAADRLFTEVVSRYALRHRVKPGITGWAQVNGWRGETRTLEQIEKRVACDLHYIENWSLSLDLRILLLTVFRGLAHRNAY